VLDLRLLPFHIVCAITTVHADVYKIRFITFLYLIRCTCFGGWHEIGRCITTIKRFFTTRCCSFQLRGSLRYLLRMVVSILSMQRKTVIMFSVAFSFMAQRESNGQCELKSRMVDVYARSSTLCHLQVQVRFSK
jgi:hypothetical protein